MLHGYTMAKVPCGNPTPKKLPTGGGEWPTFRTARAQRTVRPQRVPTSMGWPAQPHNSQPLHVLKQHSALHIAAMHTAAKRLLDRRLFCSTLLLGLLHGTTAREEQPVRDFFKR